MIEARKNINKNNPSKTATINSAKNKYSDALLKIAIK